MQNLKQKDTSVKDYTEEFYKLDIRSRHVDDEIEKVARYPNELRSRIQDKMSFVKVDSVEKAYQYALKVEEILTKRYEQRKRGRGGRFQRDKGNFNDEGGRSNNFMQDKGKSKRKNEDKGKIESKGGNSHKVGASSYKGRGNSYPRGGFHGKCYRCGEEGNRSFE